MAALMLAGQATPAAAQDLSSTIDGHVNAAVENAHNAV